VYPRYRVARQFKFKTASPGTISGSTTWVDFDNSLDLKLRANTGDVIEAGLNFIVPPVNVFSYIDVVTIVSGSPVNSFATGGSIDASGSGVGSWYVSDSVYGGAGSPILYELKFEDIGTDGIVHLRLRYRSNTTTSRDYDHVQFFAKNLGPQDDDDE
jgi:hypothetical protein